MADDGGSSRVSTVGDFPPADDPNPLKTLYPMVNEEETPLPRTWSGKDKYKFIGLSQNNLRVHYKGPGNEIHNAACVRATHPIPAACGLYYYEIKIVSNVCNGYMAVGLSLQGTNMNRLPGWDQNTFGYHGDDGYRFGESPAGMPYGPTFSTGDVIGCGVNLVDRSCFFTKNGVLLGTAFKDLSKDLYPTVGLQSNGAVLDTNFGTSGPFVYDLRYKLQEVRESVRRAILSHLDDKGLGDPCSSMMGGTLSAGSSALVGAAAWDKGKWTDILNKMVSGYLVHHGYCSTAEAFSRATNMEDFNEEITSIKNRQRISGLVMAGDVGGSIAAVEELYPSLLRDNPNLHFQLKVRQFIEIVKGTEQHGGDGSATSNGCTSNGVTVANGTADSSAVLQGKISKHTSVIQSTKSVLSSNKSSSSSREASPPQLARTEEQLNERNAAGVVSQASQLMAPLLAAEQQQRSSAGPSSTLLSRSGGDSGRNSPRHLSRQGSSSPTISTVAAAQQGLGGSSTATPSLILLRQEQETSSSAGVLPPAPADSDTEMECLDESENVAAAQAVAAVGDGNGQSSSSSNSSNSRHTEGGSSMNGVSNGLNRHTGEEDMIVDDDTTRSESQRNGALNAGEAKAGSPAPSACLSFTVSSQLSGEGVNGARRRSQVEKVLSFGRELQALSQLLRRTHGKNRNNKRMLQDAFSLLAYNDPSSSPMGWQLDTKQREPVCQALNSAILEAQNLPARPALEVCASHTQQLVNLMSRSGLGAAAFTQINSILHFNPKPFVAENTYAMPPGGVDQFASPAMEQEDGVASSPGIAKDSLASWFRKFGSPAKDDGPERLTSKPGGSGGSRKSSVGGTQSSRLNRSQRASPNGSSSSSVASGSGKRSGSNNFRPLPTDNPGGGVSPPGGIVSGVFSAASGGSSGQGGTLTAASTTTTTSSSAVSRVSSVIAPNSSGGILLESSSSSSCSNISRLLSSSNANTEVGLSIGGSTRNASSLPPGPAFIAASSLSTSASNVPSSSTPPGGSGYRDHLNGENGVRYDSREEERPMDESGSGFGSSSSLYLGSGGGGYHTAYEEDFILETIGTFDFPAQSGSNDGSTSSATPSATTSTAPPSSLATEGAGGGGSSSLLGAGTVPGASGSDGDFYYDYMSGGSNSAGVDPSRRHDTAAATTNGSSSSSTTSSSVTITGNIFGGISGGVSTIVGAVEATAAASTSGVVESSSSSSASNSSSSHNTPTSKPSTRRRRRRQERSTHHRDGSDESDDDEPMAMDDVEDASELPPPPPPRRSSPSPSEASAAGATSISSTTSSSSSSSSGASAAAVAASSSSASSQQQGSEDAAMVTDGAWPPNTRQ